MGLVPHGEREIWVEGRIFMSRNQGPFNIELLKRASEESRHIRIGLTQSGPWVTISIITGSAMFTPDALDMIRENMADAERNGNLKAVAFVVPEDTEGRNFCEAIFRPIYALANADFALFEDIDDARRWALDILAQETDRSA